MRITQNILIGGEAGQGLVTVGLLLARALARSGYEIFVTQSYESRIRGGHNTFALRTGIGPIKAGARDVDILVALNQDTVALHSHELSDRSLVLVDAALQMDHPRSPRSFLKVPFADLAAQKIYENIAALGVLGQILGLAADMLAQLVRDNFAHKKKEITEKNLNVLRRSMDWTRRRQPDFPPLPEPLARPERMVVDGNQAAALGALAAGIRFCAFYPMTPATGVALNLASAAPDIGLVVEQAEDEIAAINMALGASFAGAPSLVPTSGGGFALMTEGISLAGMTETPVVIVLGQRPGPATGLPTRTEQADLNLALYAGHGEFPRIILAPGSVEECFHLTHAAVDLAERFQSPVIVLTDQYLADTVQAVTPFNLEGLAEPARPDLSCQDPQAYKRYALGEDGISPRLLPGTGTHLVVLDSDEHTEDGHLTEDLAIRKLMVDKRLRKGRRMRDETLPPTYIGDEQSDVLLICWGSTMGAVDEAAELLRQDGKNVGVLHFRQVWPLNPEHFMDRLVTARQVICVEGNATAQFAGLLQREAGFAVTEKILRYDGLPFVAMDIVAEVERIRTP
jgi:2-oxoglutarate/2-oxoacid ferredoxin oxidoreductase subunit alpha